MKFPRLDIFGKIGMKKWTIETFHLATGLPSARGRARAGKHDARRLPHLGASRGPRAIRLLGRQGSPVPGHVRGHFRKMHFSKMHSSKMHFSKILQIFGGLVLGCIKTKFCNKICVWQHFSSSTRFASFCTAAISKFSQKIDLKISKFCENSAKFCKCRKICKIFCQISKMSAW